MDGIKLEKSIDEDSFFLLNGVELTDLLLIITMLWDLCALSDMLAQVSAVAQSESRSLAPATEDDIRLISSIKALTKGRETFPEYMKGGAFGSIPYSMITLIPASKRVMDKVYPTRIHLKHWCQLLGEEDKKSNEQG